jgi:hypothetical protein
MESKINPNSIITMSHVTSVIKGDKFSTLKKETNNQGKVCYTRDAYMLIK